MSTRITLSATGGPLKGREFVFPIRMVVAVGRAEGCLLRVQGDGSDLTASRRHCLLDIDPPSVRVRDLGSLNGTFVNGQRIGRRPMGTPPDEAIPPDRELVELHDGDWLGVGGSEFRVGIRCDPDDVPPGAASEDNTVGSVAVAGCP